MILFKRLCSILFFYSAVYSLQSQTLSAIIIDKASLDVVPFASIYFENTSIGTTSDLEGHFEFDLQGHPASNLLVSHLNYKLYKVALDQLPDTIYMTPFDRVLDELVVTKKAKNRVRKRRIKDFEDALLGKNRNKNLIRLTNPDVVILKEKKGILIASAERLLIIENKVLGYNVNFYLSKFELSVNEELIYKGDVFFEDIDAPKKKMASFKRNRVKSFKKSSRNFFINLLNNELDTEKYKYGNSVVNKNGEVIAFNEMSEDILNLTKKDSLTYEIRLSGNFTVVHNDITLTQKAIKDPAVGLSPRIKNVKKIPIQKATSIFKTKTNRIVINQYGRIVNPLDIEESGYWADVRLDNLLPLDYLYRPKGK